MDRSFAARWRIPALVAALTAIAIAVIWALSPTGRPAGRAAGDTTSSAASAGKPRVLYFRSDATMAAGAPMAATADSRSGSKLAGPHPAYILQGTLPTGPESAAVYSLAGPTAEQVNRLAAALGLPPAKHSADGWTATDGKHQLSVQAAAGGNWWYGGVPDCADGDDKTSGTCAVSVEGVATAPNAVGTATASSAASTGGTSTGGTAADGGAGSVGSGIASCVDPASKCPDTGPIPDPAMADDNTVRHAAAAILAGAGVALDGARISVGYGTITVNPLVDALPTVGLETSVSVDAAGTVQWANGWLGATVKGETYPVITAAQAFEKLQAQPRMYAMRCLAPEPAAMPGAEAGTNPAPDAPIAPSTSPSASPGTPVADPPSDIEMPCGGFTPPPMAVTGATFGLSVQWLSDNSSVLAPAWLFTTKDSESWPTPILAIDPSFIGAPADLPTDVSTGKGIVPDAPGSTSAVPTTPAPKPAVSTP